eukprot:scaffold128619_cov28-Tisochrysis_lutea.AAC.4
MPLASCSMTSRSSTFWQIRWANLRRGKRGSSETVERLVAHHQTSKVSESRSLLGANPTLSFSLTGLTSGPQSLRALSDRSRTSGSRRRTSQIVRTSCSAWTTCPSQLGRSTMRVRRQMSTSSSSERGEIARRRVGGRAFIWRMRRPCYQSL